jgi:hypothetical protein
VHVKILPLISKPLQSDNTIVLFSTDCTTNKEEIQMQRTLFLIFSFCFLALILVRMSPSHSHVPLEQAFDGPLIAPEDISFYGFMVGFPLITIAFPCSMIILILRLRAIQMDMRILRARKGECLKCGQYLHSQSQCSGCKKIADSETRDAFKRKRTWNEGGWLERFSETGLNI